MKYGVYAAYFFRGIATLTLAMTRKFNRATAFFLGFGTSLTARFYFAEKIAVYPPLAVRQNTFSSFRLLRGEKNLKIYAKSGNIDI